MSTVRRVGPTQMKGGGGEQQENQEDSFTDRLLRLKLAMSKSLSGGTHFVRLSDIQGPLKVSSHLADTAHGICSHITVVPMTDGLFVLHGVSLWLRKRALRKEHINVYIVSEILVDDLKSHYSLTVLTAAATFDGFVHEGLIDYSLNMEKEGQHLNDEEKALIDLKLTLNIKIIDRTIDDDDTGKNGINDFVCEMVTRGGRALTPHPHGEKGVWSEIDGIDNHRSKRKRGSSHSDVLSRKRSSSTYGNVEKNRNRKR